MSGTTGNGMLNPFTNLPNDRPTPSLIDGPENPFTPSAAGSQARLNGRRPTIFSTPHQGTPVPDATEFEFPVTPSMDRQEIRAQQQGALNLLGGAVVQSLLGEGIGGTVEGFGALFEVGTDLFTGRADWSNPLMEIGQGIREASQDIAPIYQTHQGQSEGWARFGDSTFWAGNAPSVASTLSMMIPGLLVGEGAVMAAGRMSRVAGLGGLSTRAARIVATTGATLASRHIENVLQASQTFDQAYQTFTDEGESEQEARRLAGEAASRTYGLGYIQLLTDLPQYYAITKGFSYANRAARQSLAEAASALSEGNVLRRIGSLARVNEPRFRIPRSLGIAGQALGEGIEEFLQEDYVREGLRYANSLRPGYEDDGTNWLDRLADLTGDKTAVDSFIFGALGGVAADVGGEAYNATRDKFRNNDANAQELVRLTERLQAAKNSLAIIARSATDGNESAFRQASDAMVLRIGLEGALGGRLDLEKEIFDGISRLSDEEILEQFAGKTEPEDPKAFVDNIRSNARQTVERLNSFEKAFNRSENKIHYTGNAEHDRFIPELAGQIALSETHAEQLQNLLVETQSQVDEMNSDTLGRFSAEEKARAANRLTNIQETLNENIKSRQEMLNDKNKQVEYLEGRNKQVKKAEADIAAAKKDKKEVEREEKATAKAEEAQAQNKVNKNEEVKRAQDDYDLSLNPDEIGDTLSAAGDLATDETNTATVAENEEDLGPESPAVPLSLTGTPQVQEDTPGAITYPLASTEEEDDSVDSTDESPRTLAKSAGLSDEDYDAIKEYIRTGDENTVSGELAAYLAELDITNVGFWDNLRDSIIANENFEDSDNADGKEVDEVKSLATTTPFPEGDDDIEAELTHTEQVLNASEKGDVETSNTSAPTRTQIATVSETNIGGLVSTFQFMTFEGKELVENPFLDPQWLNSHHWFEDDSRLVVEAVPFSEEEFAKMSGGKKYLSSAGGYPIKLVVSVRQTNGSLKQAVYKGRPVIGFVPTEKYMKLDTVQLKEFREKRRILVDLVKNNETVKFAISGIGGGKLITDADNYGGENIGDIRNKITDLNFPWRLGIVDDSLQVMAGELPLAPNVMNDSHRGVVWLVVDRPSGSVMPVALHTRNVTREEASMLVDLYVDLLNGFNVNADWISRDGTTSGLTAKELTDLLIFAGKRTKKKGTKHPRNFFYGRNTGLKVGAKTYKNAQELEAAREEVIAHLTTHKLHQVSRKGINKGHTNTKQDSIFNLFSGKLGNFTLMGTTYERGVNDGYIDFLSAGLNPILATDLPVVSETGKPVTSPFINPKVSLERIVEGSNLEVSTDRTDTDLSEDNISLIGPSEVTSPRTGATEIDIESLFDEDLPSVDVPDLGDLYREVTSINPKLITQAEIDDVRRILGDSVDIETVQELIRMAGEEGIAWGSFRDGLLTISRLGASGTGYHEAFHAVLHSFLSPGQVEVILDEARKVFGDHFTDLELEERLADNFAEYMLSDGRVKFGTKEADGFFARILNWIKSVIRFGRQSQVDRLFHEISRGEFANRAIREDRVIVTRPYYKEIGPFTQDEIRDMSDTIIYIAFETAGLYDNDNIREVISNLSMGNARAVLERFGKKVVEDYKVTIDEEAKVALAQTAIRIQQVTRGYWAQFEQTALDRLASFGITRKADTVEDPSIFNEQDEVISAKDDVSRAMKEHYEISGKDTSSAAVKLLMGLQPDAVSIDANGKPNYRLNTFGQPAFASFGALWNEVESTLEGITDYWTTDEVGNDIEVTRKEQVVQLMQNHPNANVRLLLQRITRPATQNRPAFPEEVFTQFMDALVKDNQNHTSILYGKRTRSGTVIEIAGGDTQAPYRTLVRQWAAGFKRVTLWQNVKGREERIGEFITRFDELRKLVASRPVEVQRDLILMLSEMGIEMTPAGLSRAIALQPGASVADRITALMGKVRRGPIQGLVRAAELRGKEAKAYTLSENESVVRQLAEYQASAWGDTHETTVLGPESNSYWVYSLSSSLRRFFERVRQGDTLLAKTIKNDRLGRLSVWNRVIFSNPERAKDVKVVNLFKVQEKDSGDRGKSVSDLTDPEMMMIEMNAVLLGAVGKGSLYPTLNMADKGQYQMLKGFDFHSGTIQSEDGEIVGISPSILHYFAQHVLAEITRIGIVQREMYGPEGFGSGTLDRSLWIENFHFKRKGKTLVPGNAFKVLLLPVLNWSSDNQGLTDAERDLVDMIYEEDGTVKEILGDNELRQSVIKAIASLIEVELINRIKEEIEDAEQNGLIDKPRLNEKSGKIERKLLSGFINRDVLEAYANDYGLQVKVQGQLRSTPDLNTYNHIFGDYAINSLVATMEQISLLHGDPAMYKSVEDMRKRTPAVVATGKNLRADIVRPTFRVGVLQDVISQSEYYDQIEKFYLDYYSRNPVPKGETAASYVSRILSPYKEVNKTDAQGYITLSRFKEIMVGLGRWLPKYEEAYQRLKGRELPPITPLDNVAWRDTLEMVNEFFEEVGTPNSIDSKKVDNGVHYISRDSEGKIDASLYFTVSETADSQDIPSELGVIVRPDRRFQGVATKLYNKAERDGYDIEAGSDASFHSKAGKAFQKARRRKDQNNANDEVLAEDIRLFLAPIKGVHFELNRRGIHLAPTYLKYSQAVLIPALTQGTELDKLRLMMEKEGTDGQPAFDEMVFNSGVKIGATLSTQIYEEGKINEEATIYPITLSNREWRLQVETPNHGFGAALEASQPKKNFLGGIDLDSTYELNGREIRGSDIVSAFHDVHSAISDDAYDSLSRELDMDSTGKVRNIGALAKLIREELISRGESDNLMDSVEFVGDRFALPLSASPLRRRLQSIFLSILTKRTVKTTTLGGSMIQISGQGLHKPRRFSDLTKEQRDSVQLLNEIPVPRMVEENGEWKFHPGGVLLPSWFKDKIPNADKLSAEEFRTIFKESPDLLKIVAYRIPNQAKASIDALEVVGFLPAEMGDSIVLYDEVTAKTGSDFDIDKMYVMLPNFTARDGQIKKVDYLDQINSSINTRYIRWVFSKVSGKSIKALNEDSIYKEATALDKAIVLARDAGLVDFDRFARWPMERQNTRKALENRIIDLYHGLFSDERTYVESMTPLDAVSLLPLSQHLRELAGQENDATPFGEFMGRQRRSLHKVFLGGKTGVGGSANQLVDHMISQMANMVMSVKLPVGNVVKGLDVTSLAEDKDINGERISEQLSAILNSFVDIAKDPYVFYLNMNLYTSNAAFLLIRAGAGPEYTFTFLKQPILEALVKFQDMYESNVTPTLYEKGAGLVTPVDILRRKLIEAKRILRDQAEGSSSTNLQEAPTSLKELEKMISYESEMGIINSILATPLKLDPKVLTNAITKAIGDTRIPVEQYSKMADFIENQLRVLELFETYKEKGDSLFSTVLASKADTNGTTQSIAGAIAAQNRFQSVDRNLFPNFDDKFERTMLGTYKRNSIDKVYGFLRGLFDEVSPAFLSTTDLITSSLGFRARGNEEIIRKIQDELFSYSIATSPLTPSAEELNEMIFGGNTVAHDLLRFRTDDRIKNNLFLRPGHLSYNLPDGSKPGAVTSSYRVGLRRDDSDDLVLAWKELIEHSDEDVRAFGERLVRYAMAMSGYRGGIFSFHELIPVSYLKDSTFGEFMAQNQLAFQANPDEMMGAVEQVFRHMWNDTAIVPRLYQFNSLVDPETVKKLRGTITQFSLDAERAESMITGYRRINGKSVATFPIYLTREDVVERENEHGVPIKIPITLLYRTAGIDVEGNTVYSLTQPLGYSNKGIRYYEYDGENSRTSLFHENVSVPAPAGLILGGSPVLASRFEQENGPQGRLLTEESQAHSTLTSGLFGDPESLQSAPGESNLFVPQTKLNLNLQPDNVAKILAGTKTTTVRTTKDANFIGLPVGMKAEVMIGKRIFTLYNRGLLTIEEAGGRAKMELSEDFGPNGPKFPSTSKWLDGNGKLYVYDIIPLAPAKIADPLDNLNRGNTDSTNTSNPIVPTVEFRYDLGNGREANDQQKEAIDKLDTFLKGKETAFVLTGRGGTGKTTIIKKVLSLPGAKGRSVVGATISHKAKKILAASLPGQSVVTVAKLLGIKLNQETGKFETDRYADATIDRSPNIVIIDETSMISEPLMREMLKRAPRAKFIFMGDSAQLPPVGSNGEESPTFDAANSDESKHELTERMRQGESSPIVPISDLVANNIEAGANAVRAIKPADRVTNYDKETDTGVVFVKDINKTIKAIVRDIRASDDLDHVKAITFNNERHKNPLSVGNLNNRIRQELWGDRAREEEYIPGEVLVGNEAGYTVGQEPVIMNAESYRVIEASPVKLEGTFSASSQARGYREGEYSFDGYYLILENEEGNRVAASIPVIAASSKDAYLKMKNDLMKSDPQMGYRLSEEFADLSYGYAITTHKSQGSTYRNAYVFEDNILGQTGPRNNKEKNQAFYVAITRPSARLIIISDLNNSPTTKAPSPVPSEGATETTSTEEAGIATINDALNDEHIEENPAKMSLLNRLRKPPC